MNEVAQQIAALSDKVSSNCGEQQTLMGTLQHKVCIS